MESARPFLFLLCVTFSFFAINHFFGPQQIGAPPIEAAQEVVQPVAETIQTTSAPAASEPAPQEQPSSGGFFGFFRAITQPFTQFLFFLLGALHSFTASWGLSIILLTIALRVMLYPINAWTIRTQIKTQLLGPKIAEIKERYKDDPKRAQLEQFNLYRSHGVNPIAGGCLPFLIQMPFLFGMFDVLKTHPELKGASFISPLWIPDLSAPDTLFNFGFSIPFLGSEFHLLPLIVMGAMFLQQRASQKTPKDPSEMTDQQRQQKAMGTMMLVVFLFIFYNMPAGLNLYFLCSTLLGVLQQWLMEKKIRAKTAR